MAAYSVWKLPLIIALHAQSRWERDFGPAKSLEHSPPIQASSESRVRMQSALLALAKDPDLYQDPDDIIASASDGMRTPSWTLAPALARFEARAPQVDALVDATRSASSPAWEENLVGYRKTFQGDPSLGVRVCTARALEQSRSGDVHGAQRSLEAAWVLTEPWLRPSYASHLSGVYFMISECSVLCACDQAWPGWKSRLGTCTPEVDIVTVFRARTVHDLPRIRSGRNSWSYDLALAFEAEANHDAAVFLSSWDACASSPTWARASVSSSYSPWPWTSDMFISMIQESNRRLARSAAVAVTRRVLALREVRQAMHGGGVLAWAAMEPPPDLPCPGAHLIETWLPDGSIQVDVRGLPPLAEEEFDSDWRYYWPHGVTVCSEPPDR